MKAPEKIKIIMDTDIGSDIDDALCLAYLLSQPRCDLLGITTGSSEPEKRAELADSICRYVGRDIPIFPGHGMPLVGKQHQVAVHQYEVVAGLPHQTVFPKDRAIEFMKEAIESNPHEVVLLPVGPLTNVGALFAAYPHLASLVKEVSLMGGSYFSAGLRLEEVEFNILNDAVAARMLFDSGAPIRAAGLDVSMKTLVPCTDFLSARHAKVMEPVALYAKKFLERTNDMYFHDAISATLLFDSEICQYRRGTVKVDLGAEWGRTHFSEDPLGNTLVADTIDTERFFRHYYATIGKDEEALR